ELLRRKGDESRVDLAGDVALEAPDDLPSQEPLGGSPSHVLLGARVAGEPDHDDPPERIVGDAVAAVVEAMAVRLAGRGGHGRDPTEAGERRLGSHPFWVVA